MEKLLQEIDSILVRNAVVSSNYKALNPINREEEFNKFLEMNKNYNPVLKYEHYDTKLHIKELEELNIPLETQEGKILESVRTKLLIEAKLLNNIGTNNINGAKLFGEVSKELYEKAINILEKSYDEEQEEKTITSNELKEILQKELNTYKLSNWKIMFNEHASSSVSVSSGRKQITIRDNALFTKTHAKKLCIHEIGTHVLRAANGEQQKLKVISIGLPNYLATEEGLAGYNERSQGIQSDKTMHYYALNTIVTYHAAKLSFKDTFSKIRNYCEDDEQAFNYVVRAKRGLVNTEHPGGYLKDHVYLQGYYLIEEFIKNGGNIKDLYAGKISVNEVQLVKQGILNKPTILPEFLE